MMAHKLVMLLPIRILQTIRASVTRGTGAPHKVIDMPPSVGAARHHLLGIKSRVSLGKLGSSRPPSSGSGRSAAFRTVKRDVQSQPFPDAEQIAPSLKPALHSWLINMQLVERLGNISLVPVITDKTDTVNHWGFVLERNDGLQREVSSNLLLADVYITRDPTLSSNSNRGISSCISSFIAAEIVVEPLNVI